MKQIFRCTIYLTEEKYKDTKPSNLFLRAENKDIAAKGAEQLYKEKIKENGFPENIQMKIDVSLSSDEEVKLYLHNMQNGHNSYRSLN